MITAQTATRSAVLGKRPMRQMRPHSTRRAEDLLRELAQLKAGDDSVAPAPTASPGAGIGVLHEVLAEISIDGATYRFSRLIRRRPALTLTPRELEVARLVAQGLPTKTISSILRVSPWTIVTHLRRIYGRLGIGSRAALVARLSEDGRL